MNKILLILALIVPKLAIAKIQCNEKTKHPIFCSILKLRPHLNRDFAFKLSNHIHKYSQMYKIDPYRSIAIIMQESSFRNVHTTKTVMFKKRELCDQLPYKKCILPQYTILKGIQDIGIFQLNVATLKDYKLNPIQAMEDIEYATYCHFLILKSKMKLCKKYGKDSWTCYHSRTPKLRKRYKKMVDKYYFPKKTK